MLSRQDTYHAYSDAELIQSMKKGDKQAFNAIYEKYWERLYNDTFKRLRNTELLEEIVQDVFADLWLKRERKEIEHLYPYLLMCARYQIFASYKKGKNLPQFEEPLEDMALSCLQADSLLNEKELKGCIALWLEMQPPKRKEVFRLKYLEDYSTKDISIMMGISQKTVQNQLLTAFAGLRDFLGKLMLLASLF